MITAILTAYNRGYVLNEQIFAIKNQTIPPKEIYVIYNKGSEPKVKIQDSDVKIIDMNFNSKFHGRFAFALLSKTPYVAIFDDDTFPGKKWFELCITEMNAKEGIYGSAGVIMKSECYNPHIKIGWNGKKFAESTEVDLVGHSWFVKRDWLKYMWYEEPASWTNGEDMQFSYLCQKYGNIKTYVTPYTDNKDEWGSLRGNEIGNDDMASFKIKNHSLDRNNISKEYINRGWKILNRIQ